MNKDKHDSPPPQESCTCSRDNEGKKQGEPCPLCVTDPCGLKDW